MHLRWFLFFLYFTKNLLAWQEHGLGVYLALKKYPPIANEPKVRAEELTDFLWAVEKDLEIFLRETEKKAQSLFPQYEPLPESLYFRQTGNLTDIVQRFAHAIRVNPQMPFVLYTQADPQKGCESGPKYQKPSVFGSDFLKNYTYCQLKKGQAVSPVVVLATGSDEPDHGLDIGLFHDNQTEHGKIYGFGPQPFGDPRLIYGSQAPFHMGFYHEAKIVFWAAPFLKKTYPEYRIFLYRELARFAFEKKHPYWGYRFLGWALHYITDLTQPYHATVLPGVSVWRMLWINFLSILGFPKAKENAVNLVSNRHTAIEEYQWYVLYDLLKNKKEENPLIQAFTMENLERKEYFPFYPSQVVALESRRQADDLDYWITQSFPPLYVNDPNFTFTDQDKLNLGKSMLALNSQEKANLDEKLAYLFREFGKHTRFFVQTFMDEIKRKEKPIL